MKWTELMLVVLFPVCILFGPLVAVAISSRREAAREARRRAFDRHDAAQEADKRQHPARR